MSCLRPGGGAVSEQRLGWSGRTGEESREDSVTVFKNEVTFGEARKDNIIRLDLKCHPYIPLISAFEVNATVFFFYIYANDSVVSILNFYMLRVNMLFCFLFCFFIFRLAKDIKIIMNATANNYCGCVLCMLLLQ